MIKAEDILNATHGGLDIILDCYPQAKDCVNAKKHFSIRDERTPSASIRQYDSQKYGRIWQVTDFGGEGRGENAISIYMNYKGMRQNQFNEALLQLAAKFGVTDELNHSVNKPDIRKRAARQDESDGTRSFELNDAFTEDELRILGPRVTQGDADALHWHSVKWITTVKNREVLVKSSNSHYPIFMRECLVKPANGEGEEEKFYKVYEPLNCDKGFRFSYTPAGKKPQRYINGLSELKEAYRQYNEEEERAWNSCHDDCKPYRTKKLPEAFICSGERDSLCCRSMGFHPLWFNSETYRLSAEEYREIMTYVEVLYNIPDIDETGIRKGRELALTYIDIRTIWLPKWLQTYHDNRGKSRKDLRDWMEIRSEKRNFKDLMNLAYPARFWEVFYTDKGKAKYEINTAYLYNFLTLNGYFILRDENSDTSRFIHIDGNIVEQIKVTDIREFVRTWVTDRHEEVAVVNLVLGTSKLFPASLESLDRVTLDFTSFTPTSQFFFFPNATVEVHKPVAIGDDGFKVRDRNSDHFSNFVWKENVIGHQFKKMDLMFKIKEVKEEGRKPYYDIDIHNVDSHFFGYLINTSRLFWRKETETNFNERPEEERQAYLEAHPFDIAGEGLSDLEIWEQKQNLINKIFTFGYMLHRYKDFVRAWAPMAMDNKIGENDECNGRSGKSFFFRVLSFMMKTVKLSGRNPKLMDNPHVFDQVTQDTDLLLVDDCDRYLNLGLFYDNITSDMTVNPKNNHSFTIGFDDSPKLAFTTNYVPTDFDPSSEARSLYMVFSDWYHQKTEENDYYDNRSIRDDFGKTLYAYDYTEEEWNADLNFWLQCCQFYLSVMDSGVKPQPPMENIIRRKYKADMGTNFEDWANGYFSMEGEHLDEYLERDVVFSDYARYANVNRTTMQSFTKKMKAFCEFCPWIEEMNPKDLLNSSGRIQRKVEVAPGKKVVKDMIYVRSKPVNEMDIAPDTPKEQSLFEDSDAPF